MTNKIPNNTTQAAKFISDETGISLENVKAVLASFTHKILVCLEHEVPFRINGFGKFYYKYQAKSLRKEEQGSHVAADFFQDKVKRVLHFRPISSVATSLEQWVHDLGIRNNLDSANFSTVKFEPNEIAKIRKTRILLEQSKLGFNDALFDNCDSDHLTQRILDAKSKLPTVGEIVERLIENVGS